MELTNLVVNQTARNIMQQFGTDIEKARSGVYADTAENRKLQRVGQQYGGKKQEEPSKDKPKSSAEEPKGGKGAQKDDRFSEDGIIGQDGGFNKQGKTYKRWAALREKVESGKATPEEKQEFAHLHNQYMNEKDRHAYEQSKKTDPKAKEPKYKTVDERREEYKAKSGKGKEQKENPIETMKKDKKVKDWVESVDGLCFEVFNDPDGKYGKFIDDGYDPQSRKVKDYVYAKTIEVSRPYFEEIHNALQKYGKDSVKEMLDSNTDLFGSYKGLSDYLIAKVHSEYKSKEDDNWNSYGGEYTIEHAKSLAKEWGIDVEDAKHVFNTFAQEFGGPVEWNKTEKYVFYNPDAEIKYKFDPEDESWEKVKKDAKKTHITVDESKRIQNKENNWKSYSGSYTLEHAKNLSQAWGISVEDAKNAFNSFEQEYGGPVEWSKKEKFVFSQPDSGVKYKFDPEDEVWEMNKIS